MKYSLNDLISFRIKRAEEAIKEAELLAKEGYWNTVANRLYYSVFYMASALLMKNQVNAGSHSGIKSQFHKHFIKTGIIEKKFGKLYSELFDKRQEGDYQAFVKFGKEEIAPLINDVKAFFSVLSELLRTS